MKGGFRFRNIEEEEALRTAIVPAIVPPSAGRPLQSTKREHDESENDKDRDSGSMEKDFQPPVMIEAVA